MEEVHSAQRKVNDLQSHLKFLESKLAERDAEIRILQENKGIKTQRNYGIQFGIVE